MHKALLSFTVLLVWLGAAARAQESQLDVVLKRDKLIVATYSTSPPLAYVDDSGNLVGFEIDMAREIAKDLLGDPNKVEFVVVQSDGRFPAALSGKVDFGLCSTTIYPDRAVRIAFTRPYLDIGDSGCAVFSSATTIATGSERRSEAGRSLSTKSRRMDQTLHTEARSPQFGGVS